MAEQLEQFHTLTTTEQAFELCSCRGRLIAQVKSPIAVSASSFPPSLHLRVFAHTAAWVQ
jgi:hypothetical protein